MRTHSPRRSALAPSPPAVSEAVAPSLVGAARKIRAKGPFPAPATAGNVDEFPARERAVIDAALAILRARLQRPGACITSPGAARDALLLHLGRREHECFAVLFVNAQHALIAFEEMFRGTLTQTSVYPREIVKAALRHNAAAVILAHNHPSGLPEPSAADKALTERISDALDLVDVRTLDHLIVAGDRVASFVELGLIPSHAV